MKPQLPLAILATVMLSGTPALANEEPAVVNTDGLTRLVAKKVEEYASYGTPELRRYLRATFHQHRVSIDDVTKPKTEVVAEAPAAKKEYKTRVSMMK